MIISRYLGNGYTEKQQCINYKKIMALSFLSIQFLLIYDDKLFLGLCENSRYGLLHIPVEPEEASHLDVAVSDLVSPPSASHVVFISPLFLFQNRLTLLLTRVMLL